MTPAANSLSQWSVRTFLNWLVLACLLPGATGAIALFIYEYRQDRAQLERNIFQTTRALVQAVDNHLLRVLAVAQALSTADSLARGDFASFHRRAREVVAMAGLGSNVVLRDAAGRQLLNTVVEFGRPLPPAAAPDQVRAVFATGRPAISDMFVGPVVGRPLVSVYVPVRLEGRVAYALAIGILPADFNALLQAQGLPSGWVAGIFDSAGNIVGRTRSPEQYVGHRAAAGLLEKMRASPEGSFEVTTADGIPVQSFYSTSPFSRWRVAIGIPRQVLEEELVHAFALLAGGVAALFGIGLALAWRTGGRIAHSVTALTAPAVALGTDGSAPMPRVHIKEAAEVAAAMDRAARLLQERAAALQARDADLAEAHRLAKFGTWHWDVQSGAITISESIPEIYGREVPPFPEQRGTLLTVDSWEKVNAALQQVERTGGYDLELQVNHGSGAILWVHAKCAAIRGPGGEVVALRGTVQDITEHKLADAEIRRLNAELEQRVEERTAELRRANEALLHTNTELRHFAHATAHDLQTPLRSIAGFTQLIQEAVKGRGDERVDAWSALVLDNTRRLQKLILDLLAYTRLDALGRPFETVDLGRLFDEVAVSLTALIGETGAQVVRGDLPVVQGDRTQIAQVLQNLIENAIKYNKSRPPRVTVAAERRDGYWVVSVADNGIGIDPRHYERIFEIFRRLHSYDQVPGSGIGLALCRRIVERHGGHIWVESVPGEGSVFYFSLPSREAEVEAA